MTVNLETFEQIRTLLGPRLITTLGYFREDGEAGVAEIEHAQRTGEPADMVRPAHTLKTEARQLGADDLGELCYRIETGARRCVELQESPDELLVHVARLRPLFQETLAIFDRETNPLQTRRPKPAQFGRAGV
ncbi:MULTISPECIES: Hpt domain-containing protein [Pacificimonas]|uniref:Hpt domain-containing protein n=1 Tax=Pacificimonas TaxID=1960290 RepID=UPI001CCED88D|nr:MULTISPECIES: Hpt domain-containing protein [Pacificimonas]